MKTVGSGSDTIDSTHEHDRKQDLVNRRRLSFAAAAVVGLFTLSACGTGFSAQTNQQYQAGIGADLRSGPIQVLGAVLVADEDGSAVVSATVLNTTDAPQKLVGLTATGPDGSEIPVLSTRQLTTVQPGEALRLGAEGNPVFKLSEIDAGRYFALTLVFDDAGEVAVDVPSVVRDAVYSDVVGPESAEPTSDE